MCGIAGFNWEDKGLVKRMTSVLAHRGPDDSGFFVDNGVSLGQRRLSILDLSEKGKQPMFYSKKVGSCNDVFNKRFLSSARVGVVFNGEIYNFKEIRKELRDKGYSFSTETDTEVILASYLEWGFDCVNRFNGMWAFCIWDKEKNIFFLSRDRLGQKPLYYFVKEGKFVFGSELKALVEHKDLDINCEKNVSKDAVKLYFALGFIPAPFSIYNNVFKLEARQSLVFDLKLKKVVKKWFYYEIPDFKPVYNKKKLIAEGRKLLFDATRLRLISDVPVGAFLSGGLDSSSVVGAMSRFVDLENLHTFSIGFEGKYDETKYINIVKDHFKTRHHHYYFVEKDFEDLINQFSWIYDEPFGDYSGFPTFKVSEIAKKNVTVSLSGDGGDEIFGGYDLHLIGTRLDFIKKLPRIFRLVLAKLPVKKNLNKTFSLFLLKKAFELSLNSNKEFYSKSLEKDNFKPEIFKKWSEEKLDFALRKGFNKLGEGFRLYDLLFNTLGDNFLVKVDRASMANSLEVRSPFLDYRFIEFSQKIPTKWKVDLFKTKKLMREIIKGIVPEEIVHRGKQGFTPPIEEWILKKKYLDEIDDKLGILKKIDLDLFDFLKNKVLKNKEQRLYKNYIIRLFLFVKWWEKWAI